MADPFIGEIRMFGFGFPPRDNALCYGQHLSIGQFTAAFSLINTYFGGDGRTTFAVPDLRGRSPIGQGDGPVTYPYIMGSIGGTETQTLVLDNLPSHSHSATFAGGSATAITIVHASTSMGKITEPSDGDYIAVPAQGRTPTPYAGYISESEKGTTVNLGGVQTAVQSHGQVVVGHTGNDTSFDIRSPYLAVNFSIALEGLYPPRN